MYLATSLLFVQQNTNFVQRETDPNLRSHHRGFTPSSLGNIASAADASVTLANATDVWCVFFVGDQLFCAIFGVSLLWFLGGWVV